MGFRIVTNYALGHYHFLACTRAVVESDLLFQVPLCVLVGLLCGFASVLMADATIHASRTFRKLRGGVGRVALPAAALPAVGGIVTGLLALICPQIMYRVCSRRPPFRGLLAACVL